MIVAIESGRIFEREEITHELLEHLRGLDLLFTILMDGEEIQIAGKIAALHPIGGRVAVDYTHRIEGVFHANRSFVSHLERIQVV